MISENFLDNFNFVIFDMDGVLINSEPVTMSAASAALAEIGISAARCDFEPYIGAGEEKFITEPCKKHGKEELAPKAVDRLYEIYDELVGERLTVYPAVHEALASLRRRGLRLAIASSSSRHKLEASLGAAKIPAELFDVIISGSDVTEKKPSPEIYINTMKKLSAEPHECLIIEDALTGVRAAKNAGGACLAVTTSFSAEDLVAAGADFIAEGVSALNRPETVLPVLKGDDKNA